MELTLEQKKAVALAQAKRRRLATGGAGLKPEAGPSTSMVPGGASMNAFNRGFGEGIPIVGPLVAGAADAAGSQIASWITGRSPDEERSRAAQRIQADKDAHPVATISGNVAGAVVPLSQAAAAGGVASKVLGTTGSLPQRAVAGGISGFGITGADALARGDNAEQALDKAKFGAAVGGVLPVGERVAGVVWRALRGQPLSSAESALARAIEDDGIPLAELQQRIDALGPDAVLADLGPNLQRQAGALASMPGQAQKTVRGALGDRAAGTNARIIGDVDSTLGPAPVPSRVQSGIKENMDALGPEYEALLPQARAVDTSQLALDLDSQIVNLRGEAQKAAQSVRRMLNVVGTDQLDPNPATLFQTRQAIDGLLEQEANTKVIGVLTSARRQVDQMLAEAIPGIKQVDAKFEELARQKAALGIGQQALDSGRTATRPAELDSQMVGGAVPERGVGPSAVPFRLSQGARAEIERIIGTTANDLNALKTALKGDGSWNRDRLVSLFGQRKADRLLHILDRERTFAATNNVVNANSETAARAAAQAELNAGAPQVMRDMTLTGLVATGAQKLANLGARTRQSGTNATVADALISNRVRPETVKGVADALARRSRPSKLVPASVALALNGPR